MIYWKAGGHPSSVGMAVSFSVAETGSARSSSIEWNGSNIFSVKRLAAGSAIRVERVPMDDDQVPTSWASQPWAQKKVHERNVEGGGFGWFGANQP